MTLSEIKRDVLLENRTTTPALTKKREKRNPIIKVLTLIFFSMIIPTFYILVGT